ncbi:cytochrome P450 [Caldalkalibacillus mannanilyticus]|uniref:cytochrome P450 n=1 Tax=Caldalkalibacillus mannanilyticus TaxID=1418 RepID=UPI000B1997B2|nr:cytochrome P450 [Caldalkalibacillus mannanilyticus]
MSVFSKPSGPKSIPLLGNMVDFGKDPLQFLTKCAQEFGEITRFKLERDHDVFLITNPDDIEYVLMNKENHFSKGYQRDPVMKLLLGNGLVTSEARFGLNNAAYLNLPFNPSASQVMQIRLLNWVNG